MAIRISPFSEEHVPAVIDFNRRLKAGGAPPEFQFSESPIPHWLPKADGASVYNEFFLALDGDVVRGTCVLKHQRFSFSGEIRPIVYYHHPFSEGIVNKAYTTVGLQVLMHAVRMCPMMYALGMGGYDRPLPRILVTMGWPHCLVPFFFKVLRPAQFLHNMQVLRRTSSKRIVADLAIYSGAGWLALKALQFCKSFRSHGKGASFEVV